MLRKIILSAILVAAASGFTPVRRIDLAHYDPDTIITNAPDNATVQLTARAAKAYVRERDAASAAAKIAEARAIIAERRAARLDTLRAWLVTMRDAAVLPTTKAIYQAIIDKIDDLDK